MIPKYIQMKNRLGEEISSKKYPLYSKLPTEVELAKEYGVSRSTVRQALALLEDDGIIDKHWGSGNTVIGSYESSRKNSVAVIIPRLTDRAGTDILDDLRYLLYRENLSIELFESHGSQSEERAILDQISKDIYAGCILFPASSGMPSMNSDIYRRMLHRKQPFLFLMSSPYGFTDALTVRGDDYECGYMCARHFINKGLSAIGAVFECNSSISMGRFEGYICALRDANIPFSEENVYWVYPDRYDENMNDYLMSMKDSIKALICGSVSIAESVWDFFSMASVRVPEDIGIICCENDDASSSRRISFSSAVLERPVGREAAAAFLAAWKGVSRSSVAIGYKLIQRESS